MPARQVRVATDVGVHETRILRHDLVRRVAMTDPEFVLLLLPPLERRRATADLEDQVVLVARAHLSGGKDTPDTAVEPQENGRQILDLDVDHLDILVG